MTKKSVNMNNGCDVIIKVSAMITFYLMPYCRDYPLKSLLLLVVNGSCFIFIAITRFKIQYNCFNSVFN